MKERGSEGAREGGREGAHPHPEAPREVRQTEERKETERLFLPRLVIHRRVRSKASSLEPVGSVAQGHVSKRRRWLLSHASHPSLT